MCNHTKNLYDELPQHFPKNEKAKLNDIITTFFHLKEVKNSSDYRKSLLIVTYWLIQNFPDHYITKIFSTFAEILEITYAVEEKRSCPKILRLCNLTFTHALLLFIHIIHPKSLTSRKLFGVYYHSIVKHAPIQFRLFSGRAANTEKEEAMFTAMKRDTNNSSNFHHDNVMKNIIIRAQARSKMEHTSKKNNQSYLYNLYSPIKLKLQNSLVSYHWMKRYPFEFRCLLEREADFVLEENLWWTSGNDGVVLRTSLISLPAVLF